MHAAQHAAQEARAAEEAKAREAVREAAAATARALEQLVKVQVADKPYTRVDEPANGISAEEARAERTCAFHAMTDQGYADALAGLDGGTKWRDHLFVGGYVMCAGRERWPEERRTHRLQHRATAAAAVTDARASRRSLCAGRS